MTPSKDSVLAKVRELKKYTCDSDSATTFIEKEAGNCDNCHLNEDGAWCKWHEAQYEKLVSFPSIASYIEEMSARVVQLEGALSILQKNVVLAVRRAERGLRTQANPLSDLKAVVEKLPPLETLLGTTPLCDRCKQACFKDCSKYCDIVLCENCANIPPELSSNSSIS